MKRHFKVLLVVAAVLLALVGIALLGAKTYVESDGTRSRIEAQLGRMLGLPLVITDVNLSPWAGLTIGGVSVPEEQPHGPSPEASPKAISGRTSYLQV